MLSRLVSTHQASDLILEESPENAGYDGPLSLTEETLLLGALFFPGVGQDTQQLGVQSIQHIAQEFVRILLLVSSVTRHDLRNDCVSTQSKGQRDSMRSSPSISRRTEIPGKWLLYSRSIALAMSSATPLPVAWCTCQKVQNSVSQVRHISIRFLLIAVFAFCRGRSCSHSFALCHWSRLPQ